MEDKITLGKINQIVTNIKNKYSGFSQKLVIGEHIFTVHYDAVRKNLIVWARDGADSIFYDSVEINEIEDCIIGCVEKYENGYVHCSDCGKLIKKSEVAGRYFAGMYCADCWNSKWKEIERRETYD